MLPGKNIDFIFKLLCDKGRFEHMGLVGTLTTFMFSKRSQPNKMHRKSRFEWIFEIRRFEIFEIWRFEIFRDSEIRTSKTCWGVPTATGAAAADGESRLPRNSVPGQSRGDPNFSLQMHNFFDISVVFFFFSWCERIRLVNWRMNPKKPEECPVE